VLFKNEDFTGHHDSAAHAHLSFNEIVNLNGLGMIVSGPFGTFWMGFNAHFEILGSKDAGGEIADEPSPLHVSDVKNLHCRPSWVTCDSLDRARDLPECRPHGACSTKFRKDQFFYFC